MRSARRGVARAPTGASELASKGRWTNVPKRQAGVKRDNPHPDTRNMATVPRTSLRWLLVALVALTSLLLVGSAQADETQCSLFAAPGGSDSAAGTQAAPFRTPQHLADSLSAGQTGCLRGGTYSASSAYVLSPRHGGTAGAPIVIRGYPGEEAKLVGIVYVPHGVDNVTLSDLTFRGTGSSNTVKIYSTDVAVESSDISNEWKGLSCMMLGNNSGGGQAVRTIVRGNVFHACGNPANGNKDHAIYASNILEGQIVDNEIYESAAYAIQLYPNAQRTRFAHNVVDGGPPSIRGGVIIGSEGSEAASDNVVEMNVIAYAATFNVSTIWEGAVGSGNLAKDNCLWAGGESDIRNPGGMSVTGNLIANPNFVDRGQHDYRLSSGSPCLAKVGYDTAAKLSGGAPANESSGGGPSVSPAEPVSVPSEPDTAPPATAPPATEEPEATAPAPESTTQPRESHHRRHRSSNHGGRRVALRASGHPGGSLRVRGVLHASGKRRVLIQVAAKSQWHTAVVTRTNPSGRFQALLRLRQRTASEAVRAIVPGLGRSDIRRF